MTPNEHTKWETQMTRIERARASLPNNRPLTRIERARAGYDAYQAQLAVTRTIKEQAIIARTKKSDASRALARVAKRGRK